MSNIATGPVALYHINMGENAAMIMRLNHVNGEVTLCIIFSRVSGRSFLSRCVEDGICSKIHYDSFEDFWEMYNFPDFHEEDETIIDGHAAEVLCYHLETYIELAKENYDFKEVYNLFKEDSYTEFCLPIRCHGSLDMNAAKDMSALMVNPVDGFAKYYFDKRDALALVRLFEDKFMQKQIRKAVLHSALPYDSIEPVRTYLGVTGELISYLFWIDQEFA